MTQINKILEQTLQQNIRTKDGDKETISMIFQYCSFSGVLLIFSVWISGLYSMVSYDIDFKTPLPLLVMKTTVSDSILRHKESTKILERVLSAQTDFEIQEFVASSGGRHKDSVDIQLTNLISQIKTIRDSIATMYNFKVLENHVNFADYLVDKKDSSLKYTDSQYLAVVRFKMKSNIESRKSKITPDTKFKTYKLDFDKEMELLSIEETQDLFLTRKYEYMNFLKSLTPSNITAYLSSQTAIGALSISYRNISDLSYSDLEMSKSVGDDKPPQGQFNLLINKEKHKAYISYNSDEGFTIHIE